MPSGMYLPYSHWYFIISSFQASNHLTYLFPLSFLQLGSLQPDQLGGLFRLAQTRKKDPKGKQPLNDEEEDSEEEEEEEDDLPQGNTTGGPAHESTPASSSGEEDEESDEDDEKEEQHQGAAAGGGGKNVSPANSSGDDWEDEAESSVLRQDNPLFGLRLNEKEIAAENARKRKAPDAAPIRSAKAVEERAKKLKTAPPGTQALKGFFRYVSFRRQSLSVPVKINSCLSIFVGPKLLPSEVPSQPRLPPWFRHLPRLWPLQVPIQWQVVPVPLRLLQPKPL